MRLSSEQLGGDAKSVSDFWRPRWLILLVLLFAYIVILHWTYQIKISPLFGYLGSRYRSPNSLNYAVAFGLAYVVAASLPVTLRKPSDFVVWVLYVMACVPSIVVPQYADIASPPESIKFALVVAVSFWAVVRLSDRAPRWRIAAVQTSTGTIWIFLSGVTVVVYGYLLHTTGLNFRFLSLADIRDVRFQYRDTIAATGAASAYAIGIQGYVVNPIFLAKGIYERRWLPIVAGAIGQLLIYSATGYKLIALSVPAGFAIALMFRWSRRQSGALVLQGVVLTSIMAILIDRVVGGFTYTQIFINRLLLTPGTLSAAYVSVFQDKPKAEWGYSFMAPFVNYPYQTTPAFIVGSEFSGDAQVSANANLFADGYANLGYVGIVIEGLVLVMLLWLINAAASHLPIRVSAMVLLIPSLALVNTSVFTSFLTGGMATAILVMVLLPHTGWGQLDPCGEYVVKTDTPAKKPLAGYRLPS